MSNTRVKFGYLTYDEMIARIESGEVNVYDIIYCKDQYVTYLISEDLTPIELKSRVYVFDSVIEAEHTLNNAIDTYNGQIVSVLDGDCYRGYIVNSSNGKYTIVPLYEHAGPIDYNSLNNRPVVNLVGTLDNPVTISELTSGIYSIKGQFKIHSSEETVHLSASSALFIIDANEIGILIKKITSTEIISYTITDNLVTSNAVITQDFLTEHGFITEKSVDQKIAALDFIKKEEAETYVTALVLDILDSELDLKIDQKIDEKIESVNNEEIVNLLND